MEKWTDSRSIWIKVTNTLFLPDTMNCFTTVQTSKDCLSKSLNWPCETWLAQHLTPFFLQLWNICHLFSKPHDFLLLEQQFNSRHLSVMSVISTNYCFCQFLFIYSPSGHTVRFALKHWEAQSSCFSWAPALHFFSPLLKGLTQLI